MTMLTQHIATVTDASTGYQLVITRVDRPDYKVEYEVTILTPKASEDHDQPIDTFISVDLRSDGAEPPSGARTIHAS